MFGGDGARRWYDFFAEFVVAKLSGEVCAEVPFVLLPSGQRFLLAHVDDVLLALYAKYPHDTWRPVLESG